MRELILVPQVVNDADCTVISRRDSEDAVVMSLDSITALWKPSIY